VVPDIDGLDPAAPAVGVPAVDPVVPVADEPLDVDASVKM